MKITQLKQQIKDTERVSIFVDEKYSFSLTLDQVLQEKLKKGVDIDVEQLEHFKKLSGEGKLRSRALEWLMGRPHSERELRDYLYRKKAEKEQVEVLVTEFLSKNYLNDENFARWFAEGRLRQIRGCC
jgi:regulatory protein